MTGTGSNGAGCRGDVRRRSVDRSNLDLVGVDADDFGVVVAVLVAVLPFPVILVAAIAMGEFLLLLSLVPFWLLGRSLFGTPWIIEVHRAGHGLVRQEAVSGWAASQRRIEELAGEIGATGRPAGTGSASAG